MLADDFMFYLGKAKTAILNANLKLAVDWINSNILILSKTTNMAMGTNHSLSSKPKLNLAINNMLIKQVEESKHVEIIAENK